MSRLPRVIRPTDLPHKHHAAGGLAGVYFRGDVAPPTRLKGSASENGFSGVAPCGVPPTPLSRFALSESASLALGINCGCLKKTAASGVNQDSHCRELLLTAFLIGRN